MPSRQNIVVDAIQVFTCAFLPAQPTLQTAWLGIYQTLLWYEPVNWAGFKALLHITEANNLRPSNPRKARAWTQPSEWQLRAKAVERYMAEQMNCSSDAIEQRIDLLMKRPDYRDLQRQNPLGIAFTGLARHVLELFGNPAVEYELEVDANIVFPGITFPGRSSAPSIDILVRRGGIPRAIISAKWSLRHDRMNDITNECPVYKAAYQRIYRGVDNALRFFVLTNEYSPSRLTKLLNDSCIDALVHVHKPAVTKICQLDNRLDTMLDLTELVAMSQEW